MNIGCDMVKSLGLTFFHEKVYTSSRCSALKTENLVDNAKCLIILSEEGDTVSPSSQIFDVPITNC